MGEADWVELMAACVQTRFAQAGQTPKGDTQLEIKTQLKLPYGYEIRACWDEPETEAISSKTSGAPVSLGLL